MKKRKFWLSISFVLCVILAILFLVPFYFVYVNSFKSFADILTNSASFPKQFIWDNYTRAWEILKFPKVFLNSIMITALSVLGLVLIASMAAYRLVRSPSLVNRVLFLMFVAALVIPFQSIMIPLVQVAKTLGLIKSIPGLVVSYFGFGVSFAIFLFHGFIKSVPKEIEEAGIVDGCNPYGVFWRVVFPLLKPIAITVVMINTLWIWNDFLLPLLLLQHRDLYTIPLATMAFFAEYTKQWDLALASLVLGITPILLFFVFLQRFIVEGIAAGSVKG